MQASRFSLWLATNERIAVANREAGPYGARYAHSWLSALTEQEFKEQTGGAYLIPTIVWNSTTATSSSSSSSSSSDSAAAAQQVGGSPDARAIDEQLHYHRRRLSLSTGPTYLPGRFIATNADIQGTPVNGNPDNVFEITAEMLASLPDSLDYSPLLPPPIRQLCGDCGLTGMIAGLEGNYAFSTKRPAPTISEVRPSQRHSFDLSRI